MSISKEFVFPAITAVFATLAVLTNTVGTKIFEFWGLGLPVSILWFPVTFLITDVVSEVYGERHAFFLVGVGFTMSAILLLATLAGLSLSPASFYLPGKAYDQVFSPTWRLLFASMLAYLLAQSVDVKLFHFWKRLCRGRFLWLRNNGSTMVSQFVDTVTVTFVFLYGNEAVFAGSTEQLWTMVAQVYLIKMAIAVVDTPFCYAGVWLLRKIS